jgi:hypothetical protein
MTWPSQMSNAARAPRVESMLAALVMLGPAALLGVAALRADGLARSVAVGLAVTLGLEATFLLGRYGARRATASLFTIAFYGVAAAAFRFNSPDFTSPATHLNLAASLLLPVGLFLHRELAATGGNTRQVKFLIRQLLSRKTWPADYADYRTCPHVQALYEGLKDNAAPALPLLAHDDVRIQVAVLTALEFHPTWRKDQAETVLQRARFSDEPAVRAAAVLALANVSKPRHLKALLPFLTDRDPDVRQAAGMAILWDAGRRWLEIRNDVRAALAAPHAAKDGPLPCSAAFPPIALADLVAWSTEAGTIGKRSTQTLVRHCQKAILEDGSSEAVGRVVDLVSDTSVPPALRVELAHRLQQADAFPPDVASRLLGTGHPTMLRLVAAGAVLSRSPDPKAVEVLREAGRQPNRAIALAAAVIVQKYLSIDMGLPVSLTLPEANSREAAEIARRVTQWASDPGSQSGAETPADIDAPVPDAAYF